MDAPAPDHDTVRSAARVLRLLRLMNERPIWTLQALHQASGLPKATLSRLLATLQQEGYARPEEPAGTWRLSSKVTELQAGVGTDTALLDRGRPLLLAVTRRIQWPLAIGVLDVDAIVVRFSSMPYSPLAVHTTTLGHRLSLLESAMGRAWLAACPPAVREALYEQLGLGADAVRTAGPQACGLRAWAEHDLAQVRRAGWAVRQPTAQRGSATLAVPVLPATEPGAGADAMPLAVLGMTTFGKAMTPAAIARHTPVLQDTARQLAALVLLPVQGATHGVDASHGS